MCLEIHRRQELEYSSDIIHDSQELEPTQTSISSKMGENVMISHTVASYQ